MRHRNSCIALTTAWLILGLCHCAFADTNLKVEIGWMSKMRAGRWMPVFITASSDRPRNVELILEWPTSGRSLMSVRQSFAVGPTAQTFPLVLPAVGWNLQEGSAKLVDRDSGKTLAREPKEMDAPSEFSKVSVATGSFVGISGISTQLITLQSAAGNTNIGYLPGPLVPTTALGFDQLDVLVLNQPNFSNASGSTAISDLQQQAIIGWVRTGGTLLLWPGTAGFPSSGPLIDALPARAGAHSNLDLSPGDLTAIGLPSRYKSLTAADLKPIPGAEKIPLFNSGQTSAYAIRVGLGRIIVAPLSLADLQIDDSTKSAALWKPLLGSAIEFSSVSANSQDPNAAQSYQTNHDNSEDTSSMQIADMLGNVPGAGSIGFSYIAAVLIGMLIVVGPVDWFVLKKLKRQPWTWVTTSGWILLITTGAIFAGYIFKSGELHFNTLEAVDQVDGARIAWTDYTALYSSRTQEYQMKTDADSWWQPAGLYGTSVRKDFSFHQTDAGNQPDDMVVNIWSLRFLRGDTIGQGTPLLSADLHLESSRIVGTIENLGELPMKIVRVRTRGSFSAFDMTPGNASATQPTGMLTILSHGKAQIDSGITTDPLPATMPDPMYYRYGINNAQPITESDLWRAASDLNGRRGKRMEELAATGKCAIIYAEVESDHPFPGAVLEGVKALQHHRQLIRALVELHQGPSSNDTKPQ